MHLINVKRLAWGIRPYVAIDAPGERAGGAGSGGTGSTAGRIGPNKEDGLSGWDVEAIERAVVEFMAERKAGRAS